MWQSVFLKTLAEARIYHWYIDNSNDQPHFRTFVTFSVGRFIETEHWLKVGLIYVFTNSI